MAKNHSLDLAKFTFSAEEIRDINELVYEEILHAPDLSFIHTLINGIVYDKEIGFITSSGLVGKAAQACGGTQTQDWNINTTKAKWEPKHWEIFIDECASDLETTAVTYCMNKGVKMTDLTNTDYMTIVVTVLTDAVKDFLYRLVWFNDTEAANVSSEGIITNGVDVGYFNIINGLFKQLEAAVTKKPALKVEIAANKELSAAAQMAGMTPQAAYDLLTKMYYAAPVVLRGSKNVRFLVTQSIADAYQQYLTGKGIESEYKNLVDGIQVLKFQGKDVVPMPMWDENIEAYNNLGAKLYNPHRAVFIEKGSIPVGIPSEEAFGEMEIWYERKEKKNYIRLQDKTDAKLVTENRFVFAE